MGERRRKADAAGEQSGSNLSSGSKRNMVNPMFCPERGREAVR
jgi:hypothetical protein